MDNVQEEHERAVGDGFIAELNRREGAAYVFERRGDPAPDLIYRDGADRIGLEVVTCYYDPSDARFKWENARSVPDAAWSWTGVDFDQALVANISKQIRIKCNKDYGRNCLLLVYVIPSLTTKKDMNTLIPEIRVPSEHSFAGIYLMGHFGINASSTEPSGVWELSRLRRHV